jgi:release factor glutamine methyltransferase
MLDLFLCMVYEPQEDSQLLRSCLPKDLVGKKVLEIGPGSGILSVACAQRGAEVVAVDIDPLAVKATRRAAMDAQVTVVVVEGDLFEPVSDERFNLIVCNPPYLPDEPKDPDVALDGGPEGWEFIDRLLSQAKEHLSDNGKVLLLFSSHSMPDKVAISLHKHGFVSRLLGKKEVGFFEELFVVELSQVGGD